MFRLVFRLFRGTLPRRGFMRGISGKPPRMRFRGGGGVRGRAETWLQGIVTSWNDLDYLRGLIADFTMDAMHPRKSAPFFNACIDIITERVVELELWEEMQKALDSLL